MVGSNSSKTAPRAEDVAAYVESMAEELKGMVEPHNLPTLAYLLDLVRLEAAERAKDSSNRLVASGSSLDQ